MIYRRRTHLILVPVNICAIEVAIPGFDCPHNLPQSVSVIYAHIRAPSDAPRFRPHEAWRATSRAQFVGWLCHFAAEASFEATWLLYATVMGKKTKTMNRLLREGESYSFSINYIYIYIARHANSYQDAIGPHVRNKSGSGVRSSTSILTSMRRPSSVGRYPYALMPAPPLGSRVKLSIVMSPWFRF